MQIKPLLTRAACFASWDFSMLEAPAGTDTAQPIAADMPEVVVETTAVETGATEQAAETDEQKNERVIREREENSRRQTNGVRKRINELHADKMAALRQVEILSSIVQRQQGAPAPTAQPATPGAPTREQFEDYGDFVTALAAHGGEQAATRRFEELTRQQREQFHRQQTEQSVGQMRSAFAEKVTTFAKATPDFDSVIARDDIEISDTVTALLHDADDPGAILYAIGKNPELLKQFEGKSINRQSYLLGRLEHSLKAPPAPQISKAPAPGKPVSPKGPVGQPSTIDEYYASITANHRKA